LVNWPQAHAVASSGGRYEMQTYCCLNGTNPASYPSSWYAFNAGPARFYVLEAAWNNGNVGSANLYQDDYDYHWTVNSDEYRWVANDLATHPKQVSFAFVHFPLYTSNGSEKSDPWLNGPTHLEGLLADHGVDVVFNGHAHIYERNTPSAPGMPVSYVTGGGGGMLEPVNTCAAVDAYSIGWNPASACGSATPPTTVDRVYHFLLVTVDGTQVTVTPTDELGRTFDVQTYDFS
ncbi:MAG: metallophosphoesterase, partial [Actinomycetota bacterium]|nr:metallophosphoesterase [Actinomycetota bacterium]